MTPHHVIDLAAARAAWRIMRFVDEYERSHPPVPQLSIGPLNDTDTATDGGMERLLYTRHPAVRAVLGRAHPALLDYLGGPGPAWDLLVHAAQYWFTPDDDSMAYRCLRGQFLAAQGLCGGDARLQAAVTRYRAWRVLPAGARVIHFPDGDVVRVALPPD